MMRSLLNAARQTRPRGLYDTPLGVIQIACDESYLTGIGFANEWPPQETDRKADPPGLSPFGRTPLTDLAAKQILEYFDGRRRAFTLPLAPLRDSFSARVYAALLRIPYGETRGYAEIARQLGNPNAARAVGNANHKNPWVILVPCHRVIAADGALSGYAGGQARKRFLLDLEGGYRS